MILKLLSKYLPLALENIPFSEFENFDFSLMSYSLALQNDNCKKMVNSGILKQIYVVEKFTLVFDSILE